MKNVLNVVDADDGNIIECRTLGAAIAQDLRDGARSFEHFASRYGSARVRQLLVDADEPQFVAELDALDAEEAITDVPTRADLIGDEMVRGEETLEGLVAKHGATDARELMVEAYRPELVQRLDQMQLESPQESIDFEAVFRDPTRDELAELKARQTMRSLQWLRTASMCMRLSQGRTMDELVRIYGAPIIEKRLRMAHADPRRAKEGLPPPALARAVAARIAIDDGLAQALL